MSADAPVTWSQKADDDQANAADAIREAEARLDMVGRGPMSPPKDSRPRDDPKSGNPAPRKPGGAGCDGTVVTEDGATAEVPPNMAAEVGGKSLFDDVSVDGDESEESEEPTEFKCDHLGCPKPPFSTLQKLKAHQRQCKFPAPPLVPVDADAAAALKAFDEGYKAASNKANLVGKALTAYMDIKKTKGWGGPKKLEELRKLIAAGAKKLEKTDPVKPVVVRRADKGPGAKEYLFEGGCKPASKSPELDFAAATGYTAGSSALARLIGAVAEGKEKHESVGARWATEGDWTDATIIRIARGKPGGVRIGLGQIAQERKDDSAKREAAVTASMERLKLHQETLFRHAERTANRGAPARPSGPMAFERVPSVMPDASPDERKKAMVAKMRAALSQAKGLGDLKSGL